MAIASLRFTRPLKASPGEDGGTMGEDGRWGGEKTLDVCCLPSLAEFYVDTQGVHKGQSLGVQNLTKLRLRDDMAPNMAPPRRRFLKRLRMTRNAWSPCDLLPAAVLKRKADPCSWRISVRAAPCCGKSRRWEWSEMRTWVWAEQAMLNSKKA